MTEVLIVCGVGGAGKTTSSAVLAIAHARAGRRVVLMTIDPARRLADALGLQQLGNAPTRVQLDAPGTLDALMLDRKAAWDALVRGQAPDAPTAERLLANPYYRAVSERLSGGHEYMAADTLHALATSGQWDLVVVDTPPSRHALDFLRAPERIRRLLDERLLGALLRPGTGFVGLATRGIADAVRRLAGEAMIDDLTSFFDLVRGLADGMRSRADATSQLLRSAAGRFVLVLSARTPQETEIEGFLDALQAERLRFRGFVINRWSVDPGRSGPLPPAPDTRYAATWEALGREVERRVTHAAADRGLADRLSRRHHVPVWTIPDRPEGTADAQALATLSAEMMQGTPPLP
jgi:anion-transporting  ArsA/GET3 family ATPase